MEEAKTRKLHQLRGDELDTGHPDGPLRYLWCEAFHIPGYDTVTSNPHGDQSLCRACINARNAAHTKWAAKPAGRCPCDCGTLMDADGRIRIVFPGAGR